MRGEIVIIGAGAAGLLTALYVAGGGYQTRILYKGYGATAMSSGCFDILGYSYKTKDYVGSYKEAYEYLPDNHPYKVISGGKLENFESLLKSSISDAEGLFSNFLTGTINSNMLVATLFGTVKPTAFVQETMSGAKIEEGSSYTIVGIEGIYDFNPRLVKTMLNTYLKSFGIKDVEIKETMIKRKKLADELFISYAPYLPLKVDSAKFEKALKTLISQVQTDYILIPPIISNFYTSLSLLEKFEGMISEVPAPPYYKTGLRLIRFLIDEVKKRGVKLIQVDEVKVYLRDNEGREIRFRKRGKEKKIVFDSLVLATGDLISGGLEAESFVEEDKVILRDSVLGWTLGEFSSGEIGGGEYFPMDNKDISSYGLGINENSKLLNGRGEEIRNIYVVGSLIGGYNYNFEKSGLGVALVSAYKAASAILKGD